MVKVFPIIVFFVICCQTPPRIKRFCKEAKDEKNILDTTYLKMNVLYRATEFIGVSSSKEFVSQENDMFKKYLIGYEFFKDRTYRYYLGEKNKYQLGCYKVKDNRIVLYRRYYSPQAGFFTKKNEFIIKDSLLIEMENNSPIVIYSEQIAKKYDTPYKIDLSTD